MTDLVSTLPECVDMWQRLCAYSSCVLHALRRALTFLQPSVCDQHSHLPALRSLDAKDPPPPSGSDMSGIYAPRACLSPSHACEDDRVEVWQTRQTLANFGPTTYQT